MQCFINTRDGIGVIDSSLVQFSVVNADFDAAILLPDDHKVSAEGARRLPNSTYLEHLPQVLAHLLYYGRRDVPVRYLEWPIVVKVYFMFAGFCMTKV